MSIVTANAPKSASSPRILFNGCEPHRVNRLFGLGLSRPARVKTTGYTAADAAWWAAQNADATAPTEGEEQDERQARTMTAQDYHDLAHELRDLDAHNRYIDQRAEDAELADRMEGLPSVNAHTVLRGDDGVALAVVLEHADADNLPSVTARALAVQEQRGALRSAAWITHLGRQYRMMDRDASADVLTFFGSMPIRRETIETAFGVRLPR